MDWLPTVCSITIVLKFDEMTLVFEEDLPLNFDIDAVGM